VHHLRRRRADAGFLILFGAIEGAPLGAAVDFVLLDDQATLRTDRLPVLGIGFQPATAFRTGHLVFVGLDLVFVLALVSSNSRIGHCEVRSADAEKVTLSYMLFFGRLKNFGERTPESTADNRNRRR
jgi:hypothetical protein